jgi:capsular exopolysaccharide synthesis family protein
MPVPRRAPITPANDERFAARYGMVSRGVGLSTEEPLEEPSSLYLRLADLWAMAQLQWPLIAACALLAILASLAYSAIATPEYQAKALLHLSAVAGREMEVREVIDLDSINRQNRQIFLGTQLQVLRSRPVREEVVRRYQDQGNTDLTMENGGPERLAAMMNAQARPASELLDLAVTYTDPDNAAILANLLAVVYMERNLHDRVESEEGARAWLLEQIAATEKRVDEAAAQLMAYKQEHGLADIAEESTTNQAQLTSLNQAQGEVRKEKVLLESTVHGHEQLVNTKKWRELAWEMNTPAINELESMVAQQEIAYSEQAARYGPNNPKNADAKAPFDAALTRLQSEIERTLAGERARLGVMTLRENALDVEIARVNQLLLERQELRTGHDTLLGEYERQRKYYDDLNTQLQETQLAAQTQRNNVTIVDPARPNPSPVSPQKGYNALIGAAIGALIGIGLAFLRQQIDETLRSPIEVQKYLHVPYLGMIPRLPELRDEAQLALYTFENPNSAAAESMRAIRTMLELNPPPTGLRRLLVTSAMQSEGKTSTVVRLGVAFANLGKRVVMIDGDLRRPRLHKIFNIERDPGLSELLAGQPVADVVNATGVQNLFFISAGARHDHTSEPLASTAMNRLLEQLDSQYDLVLIDSPPAALLSDAAILSKRVDGVVMLVREGVVSRFLVRDALRSLNKVGANVIGVVMNAVDLNRRGASYYRYYSYGYGQRYSRYYSDSEPNKTVAK